MSNSTYAALYCRVSREDENSITNSSSIKTQKSYLKQYTIKEKLGKYKFFVDDGYSGTNFERPGFNRLLSDIQLKKINTVIVKDLSRLGRNYLTTGYYIEHYFPTNNIRFIAINDGVDSTEKDNDFTPFRNILNEWYAKDISKKIRSAYQSHAKSGHFTGPFAPYGYKKNPNNKYNLIIDYDKSLIVQEIFSRFNNNENVYRIASELKKQKVLTPRAAIYNETHKYYSRNTVEYPYDWSP